MNDPTSRTLALLSLLQTHRHWKGAELAERLGVSERTVRRDVDRLRSLGYPVEASAGTDGGYQLGAGAELPPLLIDDEEAVALTVGLRTVAGAAIGGIEETTARVLTKLDQILPDRLRRQVEAVSSSVEFLRYAPSDETVDPATLTVLTRGCRDAEEVRFDYIDKAGNETRRLVRPQHLVVVGRRWYLVCWDVRRDDWRTFRLDRIVEARLAGVRFEPRPLPADPASFVAEALRSSPAQHRAVVDLDADPTTVRRQFGWLDATELPGGPDRGCRLELRADDPAWLASSILIVAGLGPLRAVDLDDSTRRAIARVGTHLGDLGPFRT